MLTEAQAEVFKRVAWEVAADYPYTGLGGDGMLTEAICSGGTVPSDTEPPSVPRNFVAVDTGATTVTLSWEAVTDDVSGVEYVVLRDGEQGATTPDTFLTVTRLAPNTEYSFTVKARNAAGNLSESSRARRPHLRGLERPGDAVAGRGGRRLPGAIPTRCCIGCSSFGSRFIARSLHRLTFNG